MNKTTKDQIMEAAELWMDEHNFSANEFSTETAVPANYLSYMRKGQYFIPVSGKEVDIDDKYFRMVADVIGYNYGNKSHWTLKQTPQLNQMISVLEDAEKFGYTNIIIGSTGCGKTYITDLFVKQNPKNRFKITVGSMDTIGDLLDKLGLAMRLPISGSKSRKIHTITKELNRLRLNGRNPSVIWDESEYMKQATLCNIKEFHDHLNGKCALILIGTDQLKTKIEKLKNKNAAGMPQFYRRVKYGIRELKPIDTRYKEFLEGIEDKNLVKFLQRECENYGELHDVLVPALREAERLGEPVTENLVRKILNMPKQ
ncbi:AAA family ATPase [Elizabethkingia meningoseptica]|uniref:AAA family ATPase n=1 Tax=Elizabethkingia meningoseptica TaxID=238 RepID=UPI0038926279